MTVQKMNACISADFGEVDVHPLDTVENTVCYIGISNAFYEHLHVI